MILRLLAWLATAILLFPFAFAAEAASGSLDVPVDFSNDPSHNLVQTAYDNVPGKEKMRTEWKGEAILEVYMASDFVNSVGNVTGAILYDTIYQTLKGDCPDTIGSNNNKKCWGAWHPFSTRYKGEKGKIGGGANQIHVKSSHYKNKQVRNLLIGSIAGAYEAATQLDRNCFWADDSAVNYRYCNVPLLVGAYTEDSHMYIELPSDIIDDDDGHWHCCETRELVDKKLDDLMDELKSVYPTARSMNRQVGCHLGCSNGQTESNIDVDKILAELIKLGL